MWDFSIGWSLSLMVKTTPFLVLRIVVQAGIAVAYVIATGVGATSRKFSQLKENAVWWTGGRGPGSDYSPTTSAGC